MKIDILHPTRGRPKQAMFTASDILNKLSGKFEVRYLFGLDNEDREIEDYHKLIKNIQQMYPQIQEHTFYTKNYVQCVNQLGTKIENDVIIIASDDFVFPQDWDIKIYDSILTSGKMDEEFVLAISDSHQPRILTIPIFSKKYYERFGYIYYNEYESMYSDTDFTEVAYKLNKVIEARHIVFEHNHHTFGKRKEDEIDKHHSGRSRYITGEKIFKEREKRGFDVK